MKRWVVVHFGMTGSGKTYKAEELLQHLREARVDLPIFIIDTMNEFDDGLVFDSTAQLREYLRRGRPNASQVYIVKTTDDDDAAAFFELMRVIGEADPEAGFTVVVDETSKFCSPAHIDPNLNRMIRYGRHWGCNLLMIAQRPADVHRNTTAQADCVVAFAAAENRDVDWFAKRNDDGELVGELSKQAHNYVVLGEYEHLPFAELLEDDYRYRSGTDVAEQVEES